MKTLILLAGITAAATLFFASATPRQACAAADEFNVTVSGCCKQKQGSRWVPIGRDFERCVRLNAESDHDEVFNQSGSYWWDVRC